MTNQARRAQIVKAAISLLAESGYRVATFHNIAKQAGVKSTRTISYHFANKDDLIEAVVSHIYQLISTYMADAGHHRASSPTSALEGYVRAAVGLTKDHRDPMSALMTIMLEHHLTEGREVYGDEQESHVVSEVERILIDGQAAGEFTEFDTTIMATTIQRSVDGIPFILRFNPDLDLDHYADELVATFHRAVGSPEGRSSLS
ncbi:TetR/AcrR family transcriptional regulator [Brevibacterium oceani]|uniref:TetR/AcrR family transcriptional regulator n=1 Tax=Brevibacterium oceani TaxID=358099 RepID=UPI0015E77847|nr:TetR/AcrR family transcriptional regulator [Brevibacterium oceani]